MITWYHGFLVAVGALWVFATQRDRPSARIILLATVGSFLLVHLVTCHITAAWKLLFPGAVETLTVLALLRWAPGRTGQLQAGCLVVAWLAHFICYVDIIAGTDLVYSRYENILGAVAAAQIAAFHDTIRHSICGVGAWLSQLRAGRHRPLHPASVCNPVLRDARLL